MGNWDNASFVSGRTFDVVVADYLCAVLHSLSLFCCYLPLPTRALYLSPPTLLQLLPIPSSRPYPLSPAPSVLVFAVLRLLARRADLEARLGAMDGFSPYAQTSLMPRLLSLLNDGGVVLFFGAQPLRSPKHLVDDAQHATTYASSNGARNTTMPL